MKKLIIFLAVLSTYAVSYAQEGNVEIIGAARIDMKLEDKVNQVDTNELWGYRIQIFFGNSMTSAEKTKAKFQSQYRDWSEEVYVTYKVPSWRVRIGNFYRKIDAQSMMHLLQEEFGDVFLVRDQIELPELRNHEIRE